MQRAQWLTKLYSLNFILVFLTAFLISKAAPWHKQSSLPTAALGSRVRVPVTPGGVRGGRIKIWVGFFSGFLRYSFTTNFIPPFSLAHFSYFVSFNFIHPCNGATGMLGRHPWYSQIFNVGTSLHLFPRPGPESDTTWEKISHQVAIQFYFYFITYTGWTRTSVTKKYGRYRMLIQTFFINKCVCYLKPLRRYTCFVVASIV